MWRKSFAFLLRWKWSGLLLYWYKREVVCFLLRCEGSFSIEIGGKLFASLLRPDPGVAAVRNCPGRGRQRPPVDEECPPLVLDTAMLQPVVPLLIHTVRTLIKVTVPQDFRPLGFHLQQQPHPPQVQVLHIKDAYDELKYAWLFRHLHLGIKAT